MRYGILSDTHGVLHPEVFTAFTGVNEIFHAGDIGAESVLDELEAMAPVVSVRGNCDYHPLVQRLRDKTTVVREGKRIVLVHGHLAPEAKPETLYEATAAEKPDLVIFGHTHRPLKETLRGVIFFNPGAAGKPRFGSRPTVGVLDITPAGLHLRHVPLTQPFPG